MIVYHPVRSEDAISGFIFKRLVKKFYNVNLSIYSTNDLEIFDEIIEEYKPVLFIIHCHDKYRDFQKMRDISRSIKNSHENSIVFVDYDLIIPEGYYEEHIWGYETDLYIRTQGLMPWSDEVKELLEKLFNASQQG